MAVAGKGGTLFESYSNFKQYAFSLRRLVKVTHLVKRHYFSSH